MHRRKVIRVATAYAVVAFVLLQVAEITFEPLQLPPWALTVVIIGVVLLFPIVMALSWIFDLTPDGLKRTEANENTSSTRSFLLLAVVLGLDGAAGYYLYSIYAPAVLAGTQAPLAAAAPAAGDGPATNEPGPPPNSVAVLDFADISPAGDQSYFATGVSAELRSMLSQAEDLNVAPRRRGAPNDGAIDYGLIGETFNVATVLDGTIMRQGETVQVEAQLISVESGYAMWTRTFDQPADQILTIQDEIATAVAGKLDSSYAGGLVFGGRPEAGPGTFEAYDLYLEGRELWQKRTPESLEEAIEIFNKVIDLDKGYAPAYSGLADAYLLLAAYGNLSMAEAVQQAQPAIDAALRIDGELSEAFSSLGLLYWNLGRTAAAKRHLRDAIDLDKAGENIVAHVWLAGIIGEEGSLREQELVLREGLKLDPHHLLLNINLAGNQLSSGQYQEGFGRLEEIRDIYPTQTMVLRTLASWEARTGRLEDAFIHSNQALRLEPDAPPNHAVLANLLLRLGAMESAGRVLEQGIEVGPQNMSIQMTRAEYLWRAGRLDQLRQLVEGLLEQSSDSMIASKEAMLPEFWLGMLALREGRSAEAADHFGFIVREIDDQPPGFAVDILTWTALATRAAGDDESAGGHVADAERRMEAIRLQGFQVAETAYREAVVAALSDDSNAALERFGVAVERGWMDSWAAENDLRLQSLRGDPGFVTLLDDLRKRNGDVRVQVEDRLIADR
ncbi:MAG: hypothetical protein AAGE01_05110 [Pseudomonadota bacterium]